MNFTKKWVTQIVKEALSELKGREGYLLEHNVSERAIVHHLAKYIEQRIPQHLSLDVDVEYNRDGDIPKKLMTLEPRKTSDHEKEAVTVFPDIIVHKRGKEGQNILVLEVKKLGAPKGDIKYDLEKLKAYIAKYKYKFAAHVFVGVGENYQNSEQGEARISWLEPNKIP